MGKDAPPPDARSERGSVALRDQCSWADVVLLGAVTASSSECTIALAESETKEEMGNRMWGACRPGWQNEGCGPSALLGSGHGSKGRCVIAAEASSVH